MARNTTTTPRKSTSSTRTKSSARPAPKATTSAATRAKSLSTAASKAPSTTKAKTTSTVAPSKSTEAATDWSAPQDKTELRKKELVDLVVERSGVKKRDAKPAIETALSILGEALADGQSLNLPPMGKIKVQRCKDVDGAEVLSLRMRRKTQTSEKTEETPLAEPAE